MSEERLDFTYIRGLHGERLGQPTIFQPINVASFLDICKSLDRSVSRQMEKDYLSSLRRNLKVKLFSERSEVLMQTYSSLMRYPVCPICRQPLSNNAEMHEALLTRGDVERAPFEIAVQIFCPQNCVLVHPDKCHKLAQHFLRGKRICARYLARWNGTSVSDWLEYLRDLGLTKVPEVQLQLLDWRIT